MEQYSQWLKWLFFGYMWSFLFQTTAGLMNEVVNITAHLWPIKHVLGMLIHSSQPKVAHIFMKLSIN